MIRNSLLFIVILILNCCSVGTKPCEIFNIKVADIANKSTLDEKFQEGDKCFILSVIEKLNDSNISDCDFSEIERKLHDSTLFEIMWIECYTEDWKSTSEKEQNAIKKRIYLIFKLYSRSKLFMGKKDWYLCGREVEMRKYFLEPLLYQRDDLVDAEIAEDFNRIYELCKNQD